MYKILLVDDEIVFLQTVPEILKIKLDIDHQVAIAGNITDAWQIIEKDLPNLLISDYNMPGGSGFKLCEKVKAKYPQLPVIIATAEDELPLTSFSNSPDDVLKKPYSVQALVEAVLFQYHRTNS